jgi:hypothetical protein
MSAYRWSRRLGSAVVRLSCLSCVFYGFGSANSSDLSRVRLSSLPHQLLPSLGREY